jgi:CubicO group peptidase (beta-lactamase class C family)
MMNIRTRFPRFAFLTATCVLVTATCLAQTAPSDKEIVTKTDEYMNALAGLHRFNGVILLAREGKVLVSRSYGMANFEDAVPNTQQTRFPIASMTKTFTATAVMMLQEHAKLNVQDSICKYLSDCNPTWQQITIRHLLTHTSGIPDYSDFPDWLQTRGQLASYASTIDRFKDKPLDFQSGEKYKYSNSGYVLLGYIIERVSGQTYEGFLRDNIFAPLKMVNTGYDDSKAIIPHRALGYSREGLRIIRAPYLHMPIGKSAGGLYSTVDDLLLWDKALYTDRLLSQDSLKAMFTIFKGDYGYGWHVDQQFKHRRVFHTGVILGFKTSIDRYLDDRVSIIILSNSDDTFINAAIRDLAAIVFGEMYSLPKERPSIILDPKIYDAYIGRYELGPDFILAVTKDGNKLMGEADGQRFELIPETDTKFFVREYDAQTMFTFVKDEKGQVTHLIYNRNQRAPRVR